MRSKLSDHIFKKGKFITPWNNAVGSLSKMQSWSQNRLPEYLCLGLILNKYGRKKGLEKSYFILNKLHEINKELSVPTFSLILNLDIEEQNKIETLHEISFAYDI